VRNLKSLARKNRPSFAHLMVLIIGLLMTGWVVGCTQGEEEPQADPQTDPEESDTAEDPPLEVITSISILADLVENVAGDRVSVDYLVPLGEEPEEYEPTPSDFQKLSEADLFFINGYHLETWLDQVSQNISEGRIVATAEGGPTIPLEGSNIPDPHLWLDPLLVKNYYVEAITEALIELDPEGKEVYQERAEAFKEALVELDAWIETKLSEVEDPHRVVITSENCFKYFGDAYDFYVEGIWEINAPEEGTPQQIAKIIDLVNDKDVPAVFVESTINPQYMEQVSEETGTTIGGQVYSDDLGPEGSGACTYIDMMKTNTRVFADALSP